jgi:hypothetical protein
MADGSQVRSAGFERHPESARPRTPNKNPISNPYTRFQRGGIYRFRAADPWFRPFRIT